MAASKASRDRSPRTTTPNLRRTLGVRDAVVIGAGSMIGAGAFVAWAPAAEAAGTGLLIGLAIAGLIALCNATSSAQLAALHPESGGTYVYARRQLSPFWGRMAGWGFVAGKTASCVAMALTVGTYLWPAHERIAAVLAVVAILAVNLGGLSRTVSVTRILLLISLAALFAVMVGGWTGDHTDIGRLTPIDTDWWGILRSAGFLFFAFAGYARIATLGEEVSEPAVTIPKAIPRALIAVLFLYALVAVTALATVDVSQLAASDAPLRLVAESSPDALLTFVRFGAGIAALGVLLNLIPGISRTVLAMSRRSELPRWFSKIDSGRALPIRAEFAVATVVIALIITTQLRDAIALSGVAVLSYYALTNASALTLQKDQRRWPAIIAVIGLIGCIVLIAALPVFAIVVGLSVLIVGTIAGSILTRSSSQPTVDW